MRAGVWGQDVILLRKVGLLCPHASPRSFDRSSFQLLVSKAGSWGGGI